MKIIIAGDGKVGSTLTRQLSAEGYDLTLIDSNREVLEASLEQYDVFAVAGNCASKDVLTEAGVEDADLLIAATSLDEVNLLCCMTAHALNPDLHTIARIRNPEYTYQAYAMRESFALSMAFNPERQAALEMERLLKYPGFLKRDTFAKGRVEIVELKIEADSKLKDTPLRDLHSIVRCQVLVCTVLRHGEAIIPDGSFVLQEGDRIFVTAPSATLSTLLKNLDIITHKVHRVLIAGGGRISYYLADALSKDGMDVQLIEKDLAKCEKLASDLPKICVIHGDASSQDLLESEEMSNYDALVSLTGIDELNMVISLYGHGYGIPQLITKMGRTENMQMLNNLPIGSVICPKELCCGTVVRYVRAMQNQVGAAITIHAIAEGHAEAIEFQVDEASLHCGVPLKDLKLREDVLIVCVNSHAHLEIASGTTSYQVGDTVIVVSNGQGTLHQFNDIFE